MRALILIVFIGCILCSFTDKPKRYITYYNTGSRVLKIPYGKAPDAVRWHTHTDSVNVILEVGKKVAYIKKFHSVWEYKTPSDGAWWYTRDGYHDASNAMRWYKDDTHNAIVIEYYHRSNSDDDILTRREILSGVLVDTIWK